jgi:hypothetical protein
MYFCTEQRGAGSWRHARDVVQVFEGIRNTVQRTAIKACFDLIVSCSSMFKRPKFKNLNECIELFVKPIDSL